MSIASVLRDAGIPVNDRRKVSMGGGDKRAKSKVTHIARHHSGVNVDQSMSILEGYWKSAHGWKSGGYHVVIHFDGSVDWNYDYDTVSNGVGNHNSYIFNISVLGNGRFTSAQEKSFQIVCKEVQRELGIPTKNVWGHNDFRGHEYNSCPGINMNTVRQALNNGKPVGGSNVKPDTNLKPSGKTVKVGTRAKQWETGSDIPKFVIGQTYDVLQEKSVNKSDSKKAYLIGKGKVATGWLLEQDVEGFKKSGTTSTANGSTSTANKPTPKPAYATNSESVGGVQAWLNSQYGSGLSVDNINGEKTKRAIVRAVQTELNKQFGAGLKVDSWWGNSTEAKWATVRKGASGNLTRLIQAILICSNYAIGGFDGIFGGGLHNAVVRYQKNKGLGADGIVGKGTARSMFK